MRQTLGREGTRAWLGLCEETEKSEEVFTMDETSAVLGDHHHRLSQGTERPEPREVLADLHDMEVSS